MNDLDFCLELVSRSRQPLRYIWRWISRKPLEIEVWFQRTTNRKWHSGYRMVTWPMTSRDLERSNTWPPIRLERNILTNTSATNFKFGTQLCIVNAYRSHKYFSLKVGVTSVTWPYNFWHTIKHISKTTWAIDFEFGRRLCTGNAEQAHK